MENILGDILVTIGVFLPAYFANMAPVLFVNTKLFTWLGKPIDGGKKLWGERLFGRGKTYYGVIVALLGGAVGALTSLLIVLILPYMTQVENFEAVYGVIIDNIVNHGFILFMAVTIIVINGMLIGLGAILGDLVESFLKRRLRIKSGKSLPIFDQIDFIVGAWIAIIVLYPETSWKYFIIALLITPVLHLIANIIAYKLKMKKVWW